MFATCLWERSLTVISEEDGIGYEEHFRCNLGVAFDGRLQLRGFGDFSCSGD